MVPQVQPKCFWHVQHMMVGSHLSSGQASRRTRLQADMPPGGHASRRTRLQGGHFSRRTFLQLSNFSGASSRTTLQLKASRRTGLQADTPPGGHASRRTRLQGGHFSRRTFLQLVNLTGASCRTSLQLKASRRTALQLSASRRTCLQADRPPGGQASRRTRLQADTPPAEKCS